MPKIVIFLDNGAVDHIQSSEPVEVYCVDLGDLTQGWYEEEDYCTLELDGIKTKCILYQESAHINPHLTEMVSSYAKEHIEDDQF